MSRNILLYLIILANLFGVLYGMMIYSYQLSTSPLLFWLFIPDCPLYIFLATVSVTGFMRSKLLNFITAVGLIKYGIWTEFVLLLYSPLYFSPLLFLESALLLIAHIGMIAEFILVLPKKIPALILLIALGWFLLNDFVDYGLGFHPIIPEGQMSLVALVTVALSILVPLVLYAYSEGILASPIVKKLKKALSVA